MDSYLEELRKIIPKDYLEYVSSIEKKRACERLLQIIIECVMDICILLLKGLNTRLPSDEKEVFDLLEENSIIGKEMKEVLKKMRGFRNILVHQYGKIDDEIVFENLHRLEDFYRFKEEILKFLKKCN